MIKNSKKVVEKTTDHGMLLLQPYLCMLMVAFLSCLLWIVAQKGYKLDICLALGAIFIGLSWFTWHVSQHRRDFGRIHAILTMSSIGIWVIFAVANAPWNPTVGLSWLLGGLALGLSWNIRTAIRGESREDAMALFFKDIGLEGTKMKTTSSNADQIKATISLKRGHGTVESLQKAKARIASLFAAPPNGVRIMPDTDNSAKAYLTVVRRDMLKTVIPYSWKYKQMSPNDPIVIGVYEDSEPAQFSMHSEKLGAAHMLIQGANGSGKSAGAMVMFAEAFKYLETEIWVIDCVKGSQSLGIIANDIDWFISEERLADMLFKKFPKVIKARADFLGKKRLSKWQSGCGLSFIYLHVEEASGLIANNPAFIKMMETARSVGIQITASLQRASHVSIDTAARAQFSAVLCYGVMDIADANFALPDEVIDAGANPAIWRNSKPGYCYLVHPTVDDQKWTTPLRTFLIDDDTLEQAAKERLPNDLDPVTLGALGDLYQAELDDDPDNDEEEDLELYTQEERDEVEELEEKYEVILDFDVPEPVSTEEAKIILQDKLDDLVANGVFEFTAPELGEVVALTGRSRAWLRLELEKRIKNGELEKEDFTYKLPPKIRHKDA